MFADICRIKEDNCRFSLNEKSDAKNWLETQISGKRRKKLVGDANPWKATQKIGWRRKNPAVDANPWKATQK
ncbi:hypothetical protein V7138_08820, partial [Bacillus sp. JJ1533]|uniref:hypothetical protein n=1 Tax=Bacillus sp. JJ1533 TaxID=3122959 RepID=UPI002FFF2C4E